MRLKQKVPTYRVEPVDGRGLHMTVHSIPKINIGQTIIHKSIMQRLTHVQTPDGKEMGFFGLLEYVQLLTHACRKLKKPGDVLGMCYPTSRDTADEQGIVTPGMAAKVGASHASIEAAISRLESAGFIRHERKRAQAAEWANNRYYLDLGLVIHDDNTLGHVDTKDMKDYAYIPDVFLQQGKKLDYYTTMVYVYLCVCKQHGKDGKYSKEGTCFPTIAEISHGLSVSYDTVERAIKKLIALHMLTKVRRGEHDPNIYTVLPIPDMLLQTPDKAYCPAKHNLLSYGGEKTNRRLLPVWSSTAKKAIPVTCYTMQNLVDTIMARKLCTLKPEDTRVLTTQVKEHGLDLMLHTLDAVEDLRLPCSFDNVFMLGAKKYTEMGAQKQEMQKATLSMISRGK